MDMNDNIMDQVRKSWSELNPVKITYNEIEKMNEETTTFLPTSELKEHVNHPVHYLGTRKYEPIDVINDWKLNFQTGNAVKYISRAGRKDVDKTPEENIDKIIEDLEKSIWYLRWEINRLKSEKTFTPRLGVI